MKPTPRIGIAGMGRMGQAMAGRVLEAGLGLTVFNRTPERCRPMAERGATVADSPADLAAAADVIITMVSSGAAAEELATGEDGLLASADGKVWAEMSTIGPEKAIELGRKAARAGVGFADAPVSGSVSVAEAGQLTVMMGGSPDDVRRLEPALSPFSRISYHLGGIGAGAAMKLAVNVMIASSAHVISEALVLAESAGITRELAYEVIADSAVASPFVKYKQAAFLDPENEPVAFSLDLMRKDLALAESLGSRAGVPMLAAEAAGEAMRAAAESEGGDRDLVAVADSLRRISRQSKRNEVTDG